MGSRMLPTIPTQPDVVVTSRKRAFAEPQQPSSKRARRAISIAGETFNDSGNESDAPFQPEDIANDIPTPQSPSPSDDRFILRPNVYACTFEGCRRTFNRPCRRDEHERSHTGARPFKCEVPGCGKTFQRDYHLSRHKKDHEGVREHTCTWEGCNKAYGTRQKLKAHLESHEKKKAFTCTGYGDCKEVFRKKNTLQAHIASVHLKQKPYPCTYTDHFTGQPCTKGYDTAGKLNGHVSKIHENGERFVCSICSETTTDSGISMPMDDSSGPATPASTTVSMPAYAFPSYNLLQSHMAKAHSPACPHCNTSCASKRDLTNHIEVMHPEAAAILPPPPPAQTYPCTFHDCNRIFTKKGNLVVHTKTVHENIKKFICGATDLSASTRLVYDNGESAGWDTKGCGSSFSTKAQLENHVRTNHLGLENWDTALKRRKGILPAVPKSKGLGGGNKKAKAISGIALLTGHGYEDGGRDITCLIPECKNLFFRDVDLQRHCAAVHGMAEVEMEEKIRERDALSGGVFWYGGIDPAEERGFAEYEEDDEAFDAAFLGRRRPSDEVPVDPSLESMSRVAEYVHGVESGLE